MKRGARKRSCRHTLTSLPRAARQCSTLSRGRGAFHRGSPGRAPLRAPVWSATPAGRRARPLHVFIDVRKLRLDPSAALLSRAFSGRVRFHDFCRSMFQRALLWTARTSRTSGNPWAGTAVVSIDRRLSIEDYRRRYSGSGAEEHRASAFPPGIAPARDFAPTPIASDTSCRGHCLSPCLEEAREADEAASAAHACKACAAKGPCDA